MNLIPEKLYKKWISMSKGYGVKKRIERISCLDTANLVKTLLENKKYKDSALIYDMCQGHTGQVRKNKEVWKILSRNSKLLADILSDVENKYYDPIFFISFDKKRMQGDDCISKGCSFEIKKQWNGLRLTFSISDPKVKTIYLMLDDVLLKKINVAIEGENRPDWKFSYIIKRDSLKHFNERSSLVVVSNNNDVLSYHGAKEVEINIPTGKGNISEILSSRGELSKKGNIQPSSEEIRVFQEEYLSLYDELNKVFETSVGKPLFLMYGTLLGLYRNGDYIDGDDDFDVGYVSDQNDPINVKIETTKIMSILVKNGFDVLLTRRGRPFRISKGNAKIHLDVRPLWEQGGNVWAHIRAKLNMNIQEFREVEERDFRGRKVYIPTGTESFLESYYGKNWRIPDPGFSNGSTFISDHIIENLLLCTYSLEEQDDIRKSFENMYDKSRGEFVSTSLYPLYPLDRYNIKCGF
nr:hypothetical protein [Halomonas sp. 1513]